jgi:beta-lactam-binding protein with PASTA domain
MEEHKGEKVPSPVSGDGAALKGRFLFLTGALTLFLTGAACTVVFFLFVNRPEQMMVPNVTGKELTAALQEMQVKELYPKIQLRFSDSPADKGRILEQNPSPGSIVKAGRRITLVVSQGVLIDTLEDFSGQNLDEARARLQAIFSGTSRPTITFTEPVYASHSAPAGTILTQDPLPGTQIFDPIQVRLVVSRGPEMDMAPVPRLTGLSLNEALQALQGSRIIFDWTSQGPSGNEQAGTVVWQEPARQEMPVGTRLQAIAALPEKMERGLAYGIVHVQVPEFPYPVPVVLRGRSPSRQEAVLASFMHTGGALSVPYGLPPQPELTLVAAGSVVAREIVRGE